MEGVMAAVDHFNEEAFQHLKNNIKADIRNVKGIVVISALVDIYKGEEVFTPWKRGTSEFTFSVERAKELHSNVLGTLLRYFNNSSYLDRGVVNFKLVRGVNFILAQPECILSPEGEGGNLETGSMKARWDILANTPLSVNSPKLSNLL